MREDIRPELTEFLTPGEIFCRILVVESLTYLPRLRQMFPMAELYAVTSEEDFSRAAEYVGLEVNWRVLDYQKTPLPFPTAFFDYIISDLTLETVENPQDIAAGFGTFLKETGFWLTSFRNIRYWRIIDELRDGHFYGIITRMYARAEFERLLYASFYKYVVMSPQVIAAPDGLIAELEAAGFENISHDLEAAFWLVKAARSMPEMALLKSMYTATERQQLSRLLHRIEYDVAADKSCAALWELYDRTQMFPDYLAEFIRQAVFHREKFYGLLRQNSPTRRDTIDALIECSTRQSYAEDDS